MNTVNENRAIENVMTNIGVLPTPNNSYPSQNSSYASQNLVNASSASYNKNLTRNQQPMNKLQQPMNKIQQNSTASYPCQIPVNPSAIPVNSSLLLSEQGKTAKADLEILVATGKTKDFLGKQLTFNDLGPVVQTMLATNAGVILNVALSPSLYSS